jgi:type VI protein secretion system component VasK
MNVLKKYAGIIWLVLGPIVIGVLLYAAFTNIDTKGTKDINNPIPWVIIIGIFTPVAVGLSLFGWYALKGMYTKLPEDSTQL